VCRTHDCLINVEIQYISQPFWDLRMLVHAGGLVYKQIRKGFDWSHISDEGFCFDKHGKIQPAFRETVVIGLMVNKPIHRPDSVLHGLPWYKVTPWTEYEVSRIFRIKQDDQPDVIMPGLIFHQYNLYAISRKLKENESEDNSRLMRWLRLFARSSAKRLSELKYLQKEEPVLWKAYEVLTHLPPQIQKENKEAQEMYQLTEQEKSLFTQIGLETGIEKGIEKEKVEVAKKLHKKGMDLAFIAETTDLSEKYLQVLFSDRT